jgi:biotin synthase
MNSRTSVSNGLLVRVASRAEAGRGASTDEALELARDACLDELLLAAGRVRMAHFGNRLQCCSILGVRTGRCEEDCRFCAQSGHYATNVMPTDLLDEAKVRTAAREALRNGSDALGLVSSGCGLTADSLDAMCDLLGAVRAEGLRVHASLGMVGSDVARRLAAAGVCVYNHNIETARSFFGKVCSTHSFEDRLRTLAALREAGIARCCGGIFGMGESWVQRVEMADELRRLEVERVPINFLIPIPGTPLAPCQVLSPIEALRIIALFRLMLPRVWIQVCGGREAVLRSLQPLCFSSGATGVILGNYLTVKGRDVREDVDMIRDLGLELGG